MNDSFVRARNKIFNRAYSSWMKKMFFKIDPHFMHDSMLIMGKILGSNPIARSLVGLCFNNSNNSILSQNINGVNFPNPIGLSAGFDKNAELTQILRHVNFGFMEAGSITAKPCAGNPKPWLWRLPESKSILVYYGLKNDGAKIIAEKLRRLFKKKKCPITLGISIAKTNCRETADTPVGKDDYIAGIKEFMDIGDYLTINISCPNAFGGQSFAEPENLKLLLEDMDALHISKPVFLKLSPDTEREKIDAIIELADKHGIAGFICSNLTKKRQGNALLKPDELLKIPDDRGGLSGKPLEAAANELIAHVHKKTGGNKIIIGCGGIFSGADAYKKIRLGANLLQLITGMIFEGPQLISQINLDLADLLKKDGFNHISEAVGADFKNF